MGRRDVAEEGWVTQWTSGFGPAPVGIRSPCRGSASTGMSERMLASSAGISSIRGKKVKVSLNPYLVVFYAACQMQI